MNTKTLERTIVWLAGIVIIGFVILVAVNVARAATCIETGNVTLTWVANPEPDVAGYEMYRSVTGVNGTYEKISGDTLIADTTFVDVFMPDGEYTPFYKLVAVDECGNRSPMSEASAGTIRHDTVAPNAPIAPDESVTP